jgi:hypothetical protein
MATLLQQLVQLQPAAKPEIAPAPKYLFLPAVFTEEIKNSQMRKIMLNV